MSGKPDILNERAGERAKKKPMPEWKDPMLARLTHDPFSSGEWIYERKLDGERAMAYLDSGGSVRLMSRNRKSINRQYPELREALESQAPAGCILDGEIVTFNREGVTDFQKLQPRMQSSSTEEARKSNVPVFFYLFDCLNMAGHDVTSCPLRFRKKILKRALVWRKPLRFTPHRNGDGLNHYRRACRKGWEGVIAKKADSAYVHSRSGNWLKFKCVMQQEFVICGFTDPAGSRVGFGALLLGFYRHGKLVYAGEVGTGYDEATLKDLRNRMDSLERERDPYDEGDPPTRGVHFLTPKLVCEVAFSEWTSGDKLRHPRFKGLRRDKEPRDVHREMESQSVDD